LEEEKNKLLVTVSPHIFSGLTTRQIMRQVIFSLIPAMLASFYFFGFRAFLVVMVSVLSCLLSEEIFQRIVGKPSTISDGSAVLTGILLAFCLPSTLPLYMVFVGGFVSIIFGKMLFGGLGHNLFNPALVGRAFLLASWPQQMTTWPLPGKVFLGIYDAVASATPLAKVKLLGQYSYSYSDLFIGNVGGSLGETSALLLLIGGIYLILRKIISPLIPLTFITSVYVLSYFLGYDPLYSILAGGVFLGAFFMATDYVTSPITTKGKVIFGIGAGILTVLIRKYGGYPEGVCYAILFMNAFVPLIEIWTKQKVYGEKNENH